MRHLALLALLLLALPAAARAQQIDLTSGGPIEVTARDGLEWRQNQRMVIASGEARAVRGGVTVLADRLIAYYRPKAGAPQGAARPAGAAGPTTDALDSSGNEIYRLEAVGHVRILTATDEAQGDRAVYDLDQGVMVMTGHDLKLTTPQEVLTARDSLEYWSLKRMAVARGAASVTTSDGRRITADTLVAYTKPDAAPTAQAARPAAQKAADTATPGGPPSQDALASSGKLDRVEAFGNVMIRTATDTVQGDRAIYVPDIGIARLIGHVRITRGQNQLNGNEADVNMKTGIARLVATGEGRVQGLVVPNDPTNRAAAPGETEPAPAGKTGGPQ
jgi:lipopolysaccharide export system protein LptA